MKQKDIALIAIIVVVSATISFVISNKLFVTPSNREQQVEVVDPITTTFTSPSTKYFTDQSIDPTLQTHIGGDNNQNPFNGSSQ